MASAQAKSTDTRGKRTRAEIAAQTRDAILNAACDVIAETGFEKIRMRMVADRAGVSTAALHYHFDTREKLFAEALHYSFAHTGAEVYQAKGNGVTASARLARIIAASLPLTPGLRREWAMWQELWCRAGRDPASRILALDLYRAHTSWIEENLADGIASGEFRSCDTAEHAQLISSLCDGFGVQLMIDNPTLPVASVSAAIWSIAIGPLGLDLPYPEHPR